MIVLVAGRFRPARSSMRCCGFSTPEHSGTCCRSIAPTTRPSIAALQQWCPNELLREALTELANTLRKQSAIDESEYFIDATFASAKDGGDEFGPTGRRKGVKIMAIVDRHGLPLAISTHAASHHEVTLVQLSFELYMIAAKPQDLIGDEAYDSDRLDAELCEDGVEMIAPHRSTLAVCNHAQDGGHLRHYQRRWTVERCFAWLQWHRRLLVRWDYYPHNVFGFVQIAAISILPK